MGHQSSSEAQPPRRKHLPATPPKLSEPERLAMMDALVEGELEQLKTRLLSAMAHELRTPLASLRIAAGLLVSAPPTGATEEHRQLFQLILHSSDRLDLLINSFLDYAHLEAKRLQLHMQTLDLRLILESVADLLEPYYHAKGQILNLHLPEQPINVRGDPFRLRSAAQALLDTASKRCPTDGRLNMGCRIQEGGAFGWVCASGPRVPEEAREQIFSHSYWQTAEGSPSLEDFGLGLPLASTLMSLHGGKLWLAEPETQEEGICFHFSLPLLLT